MKALASIAAFGVGVSLSTIAPTNPIPGSMVHAEVRIHQRTQSCAQCQAVEVMLMDQQSRVKLLLGGTTLEEAVEAFPIPPSGMEAYEGRPRPVRAGTAPALPDGTQSLTRKTVFNPWGSMNALYFDSNNRLIQIVSLGQLPNGANSLSAAEIERLKLVVKSRDGETIMYKAPASGRSTLMVGLDPGGSGEIRGSILTYQCATSP